MDPEHPNAADDTSAEHPPYIGPARGGSPFEPVRIGAILGKDGLFSRFTKSEDEDQVEPVAETVEVDGVQAEEATEEVAEAAEPENPDPGDFEPVAADEWLADLEAAPDSAQEPIQENAELEPTADPADVESLGIEAEAEIEEVIDLDVVNHEAVGRENAEFEADEEEVSGENGVAATVVSPLSPIAPTWAERLDATDDHAEPELESVASETDGHSDPVLEPIEDPALELTVDTFGDEQEMPEEELSDDEVVAEAEADIPDDVLAGHAVEEEVLSGVEAIGELDEVDSDESVDADFEDLAEVVDLFDDDHDDTVGGGEDNANHAEAVEVDDPLAADELAADDLAADELADEDEDELATIDLRSEAPSSAFAIERPTLETATGLVTIEVADTDDTDNDDSDTDAENRDRLGDAATDSEELDEDVELLDAGDSGDLETQDDADEREAVLVDLFADSDGAGVQDAAEDEVTATQAMFAAGLAAEDSADAAEEATDASEDRTEAADEDTAEDTADASEETDETLDAAAGTEVASEIEPDDSDRMPSMEDLRAMAADLDDVDAILERLDSAEDELLAEADDAEATFAEPALDLTPAD